MSCMSAGCILESGAQAGPYKKLQLLQSGGMLLAVCSIYSQALVSQQMHASAGATSMWYQQGQISC